MDEILNFTESVSEGFSSYSSHVQPFKRWKIPNLNKDHNSVFIYFYQYIIMYFFLPKRHLCFALLTYK